MKLAKSLLLGSAAALTVAAGAQAADLPSRKAAPVQYVKICDAYGAGFFYIPGTDTCLRIGGYVRAEYDFNPGKAIRSVSTGAVTQIGSAQDQTGLEARGRIDVDARTQTAWGTVQTVVQLRAANTDGLRTTAATSNFMTSYTPVGNSNSALTMERGYIRFAGLTAGVAEENLNTMPSYMYSSNVYPGFPNGIMELVYTATFGGGFSATIGIEIAAWISATPSRQRPLPRPDLAAPCLFPTSAQPLHQPVGHRLSTHRQRPLRRVLGLYPSRRHGRQRHRGLHRLGGFADRSGLHDHLQPAGRTDQIWRMGLYRINRREAADDRTG